MDAYESTKKLPKTVLPAGIEADEELGPSVNWANDSSLRRLQGHPTPTTSSALRASIARRWSGVSLKNSEAYDFDTYSALSRHEFRLVRLLPSSDDEQPVRCEVQTFWLENSPKYDALSYVWGGYDNDGHEVFVNGVPLTVWSNLNNALRQLSKLNTDQWLWIDRMCIDMQNREEHAVQVTNMKTIFTQAHKVIVWLGDSLNARNLMTALGSLPDNIAPEVQTVLKPFSELFQNAWFSRVWTIQEYVLAREVVFQWGADIIDAEKLVAGTDFVVEMLSTSAHLKPSLDQDIEDIQNNIRGFRYFNWVRSTWREDPGDIAAFGRLIATAQELHAYNPLDYVYGLLALAPASLVNFQPDYTLSITEMYLRLARALSLIDRTDSAINYIVRKYLVADSTAAPEWLPGWIDALFWRVSLFLKHSRSSENIQSVVIECLEVLTIETRPHKTNVYLSTIEKSTYAKCLQQIFTIASHVLSRTERPGSNTLTAMFKLEDPEPSISIVRGIEPSFLNHVEENFSDSGYSSASDSFEQTSLLAEGIAAHLLDHDFFHRLLSAAEAIEKRDDVLAEHLRPCIRQLGTELDSVANDSLELLAAQELRRHASFISRALVTRIRQHDTDEAADIRVQRESRIARLLDELSLRQKSRLRNAFENQDQGLGSPSEGKESDTGTRSPAEEGIPQQQMPETKLNLIKEFIFSDFAFMPFLHLVSRLLYSDPLKLIETEVNQQLEKEADSSGVLNAIFRLTWDLDAFMCREGIRSEDRIDYERLCKLLVISGTVKNCYATNCESYLKWVWPESSQYVVKALFSNEASQSTDTLPTALEPRIIIETSRGQYTKLLVSVSGSRKHLVEVAQQLAWLAAVFKEAPESEQLYRSDTLFFATADAVFEIIDLPAKRILPHDEACWMPLFARSVIAYEYPIPQRGEENGIELPFHFMASLAGPLYPMRYDGGFCLKAHSRILYPTAVTLDAIPRIQWHYAHKPGTRLDPPWRGSKNDDWQSIKAVFPKQFVEARTFLGYCKKVVVDIGASKPREYYKRILYSGLNNESHAAAAGISSIGVTTAALLPIALTANIAIVRTNALAVQADTKRGYQDLLEEAQVRPIILYDSAPESARGWMLPLSCVLLHMVQTSLARRESMPEIYPYISQRSDPGKEASRALLENWAFVVRKTFDNQLEKDKLLRDLVVDFWENICNKQLQDLLAITQADYSVEFQRGKLYGWEYMDVVRNTNSMRRQITDKTNWGLFREACVILVSKNLGDVIRADPATSVCAKWQPIRTKRMYLTATIHSLKTLAYQNGDDPETITSFRLTEKGYWHYKPKELFLDCAGCESGRCVKKPQYLQPEAPQDLLTLIPPSEGAVVFGRQFLEKSQRRPAEKTKASPSSKSAYRAWPRKAASLLGRSVVKNTSARITEMISGTVNAADQSEAAISLLEEESAEDS